MAQDAAPRFEPGMRVRLAQAAPGTPFDSETRMTVLAPEERNSAGIYQVQVRTDSGVEWSSRADNLLIVSTTLDELANQAALMGLKDNSDSEVLPDADDRKTPDVNAETDNPADLNYNFRGEKWVSDEDEDHDPIETKETLDRMRIPFTHGEEFKEDPQDPNNQAGPNDRNARKPINVARDFDDIEEQRTHNDRLESSVFGNVQKLFESASETLRKLEESKEDVDLTEKYEAELKTAWKDHLEPEMKKYQGGQKMLKLIKANFTEQESIFNIKAWLFAEQEAMLKRGMIKGKTLEERFANGKREAVNLMVKATAGWHYRGEKKPTKTITVDGVDVRTYGPGTRSPLRKKHLHCREKGSKSDMTIQGKRIMEWKAAVYSNSVFVHKSLHQPVRMYDARSDARSAQKRFEMSRRYENTLPFAISSESANMFMWMFLNKDGFWKKTHAKNPDEDVIRAVEAFYYREDVDFNWEAKLAEAWENEDKWSGKP